MNTIQTKELLREVAAQEFPSFLTLYVYLPHGLSIMKRLPIQEVVSNIELLDTVANQKEIRFCLTSSLSVYLANVNHVIDTKAVGYYTLGMGKYLVTNLKRSMSEDLFKY